MEFSEIEKTIKDIKNLKIQQPVNIGNIIIQQPNLNNKNLTG